MKTYIKPILVTLALLGLSCLWTVWQPVTIDLHVLHSFFEIFGVTYAIIVGFALFMVSENYNSFKRRLHAEVDDLQDLRDYLMYVDGQDELVREIKANIRKYVEHVLNVEWPAMMGRNHVEMDTPEEMYAVMRSVNKIQRTNESDLIALERLIATIASITTHRMERLHAAHEKLPSPFRYLVMTLSVFLLFAFSLMPIPSLGERLLLGSLVTVSSILIVHVILDIADPFTGFWRVEPDSLRTLLKRL